MTTDPIRSSGPPASVAAYAWTDTRDLTALHTSITDKQNMSKTGPKYADCNDQPETNTDQHDPERNQNP
jgi:hypothetical protein